jgi:hypothetical protein
MLNNEYLIRGTHRAARADDYLHGWPSFACADYGHGIVWGTYLLPQVPWARLLSVPLRELQGVPPISPVTLGPVEWALHRWAVAHGYKTALPTFEYTDYHDGNGRVYGVLAFDNDSPVDARDVPGADLPGSSPVHDYGQCEDAAANWRAVNLWAYRHQYPAGFPDFEHADYGHGQVYGSLLVQGASGLIFRDTPETEIRHLLGLPDHDGPPRTGTASANLHRKGVQPFRGEIYSAPEDAGSWEESPSTSSARTPTITTTSGACGKTSANR